MVSNCEILKELGEAFYSASVMADLGERLIKEMDKEQEGGTQEKQDQGFHPRTGTPMENITDLLTPGRSILSLIDCLR